MSNHRMSRAPGAVPGRVSRALGALLATALCLGAVSSAQAQKAAIITSTRSSESAWWQYVKDKITKTGLYTQVDQVDCAFRDPTLMQLADYKLVVVVGSDYGLSSGDGVGNTLGDYMATTGGSVLMFQPFVWQEGLFGAPAIAGKFEMGYSLTTHGNANTQKATKRGTVLNNDPLVDGVPVFECGDKCTRVTGQMPVPGATVVAYWDDGTILAVRGKKRVDLNMNPADDDVIDGSWEAKAGDLVTNAILYLSAPMLQSPRKVGFPGTGLGGASAYQTITFRNISDGPIDINDIGIDGAGKSQFVWKSDMAPRAGMPYTLPVGATMTVQAAFKPQVQGVHKATLFLSLAGLPRIETPLEGTSKGNLYVSLSPIDFGGHALGETVPKVTVRLKNVGSAPIDLNKPVVGDTMHYELKPAVPDAKVTMFAGASYTFELEFKTGMTPGEFNTEITVTSTDASSPLTIPVRGLAGPPKAKVPYASILLPDVPAGAKGLPMNITLTNEGFSDLKVDSITASSADFEVPNAPSAMSPLVVPAKESRIFQLVFAPQMEGLRTGKLTIKSNEPAPMMGTSDIVIDLAGNGTKPKFKVSTNELNFSMVNIGTAVPPQTVNLTNEGDGDLTVKEVSIMPAAMGAGAESFAVSTPDPVPFVLRAGATVPVKVTFTPKSAGTLAATLKIVTDLATGGAAAIALKGEANGAVGQLSVAKVDFGDAKVKQMASKTFTLTNVGNRDLTILKTKMNPMVSVFSVSGPADGTKINPGKSVTFTVNTIPAMVGVATGAVQIETDDPATAGGTKYNVALSVNGVIGQVSVMPAVVDFSTKPLYVGQRSEMMGFKVTNTGNVVIDNLQVKLSGTDAGDFSVVTGYKTKLNPGEASDIGIVFEPHVPKIAHTATAVIEADGVQAMMMVSLKGSSMAALVTVQPASLAFGKVTTGEASMAKSFSLLNEGAQDLELDIVVPPTEDFAVDTSMTKTMLKAMDSTKVYVTFTPKTTGQKSESIEIRLKGTQLNIATVSIEGDGTKPAAPVPMEQGCSAAHRSAAPAGASLLLCGLAVLGLLLRRRREALL